MQRLLRKVTDYPWLLFGLIVLVLYAPAWHAGFVTDAIDWLYDAETLSFTDYLSRRNSTVHGLYQTTQLITLGFYKLFGTARLPWFLLFVVMQTAAAYMLYFLCFYLFTAANLRHRRDKALLGAIFFCISPYLSEVLVWKACFHYLQGLLLMLGILLCVERHIYTRQAYCTWLAAGLFLISAFSLEMFYLTPVFTASLLFFYRSLGWSMAVKWRTWLKFLLPQAAIISLHLFVFHQVYGEWLGRGAGSTFSVPFSEHLSTVAKYAFHIVLFGRFWPQETKELVYSWLEQPAVLSVFYAIALTLAGITWYRTRKGYGREQIGLLLFFWTLLSVVLVLPMPFERLFDLSGNRYLYLPMAFATMLASQLVNTLSWKWLRVGLICTWIGFSTYLTLRTNRHWQTSERINQSLLKSFAQPHGKTTILLSMPYCYKGIPMINAWPNGNFARMQAVLHRPIAGKVYDGVAFNMIAPDNGSEVQRINDSTLKVTLSQWGTWWWYKDFGASDYETPDYRIAMRDPGHWYEIVLKRPIADYQLLYQVGDKWQAVAK